MRNPALALGASREGEGEGEGEDADVREARTRGAAFLPAWLLRDGALERAGRGGGAS